ncbi:unnamed protein product [Nezara viridula]|uniref:Uncharacterized protein n=1 Tax=Nezara viridula TaxID=85310 RepID=A0A9P0EBA4_NEZVI|nr:unnamed protein product [Nezara viridula]
MRSLLVEKNSQLPILGQQPPPPLVNISSVKGLLDINLPSLPRPSPSDKCSSLPRSASQQPTVPVIIHTPDFAQLRSSGGSRQQWPSQLVYQPKLNSLLHLCRNATVSQLLKVKRRGDREDALRRTGEKLRGCHEALSRSAAEWKASETVWLSQGVKVRKTRGCHKGHRGKKD